MRRWLLGGESFVSITAIAGGVLLIAAPDGHLLDARRSALAGSPFADWRVPGVLLLVLVGGGFALASLSEWRRAPWATGLSVSAGAGLVAFEIVEAIWIEPQPLQAVFVLVGLAVIAFAFAARIEAPTPLVQGRPAHPLREIAMTGSIEPLARGAAPFRVGDVMTTEVVTVRAFAGLKEIARVLRTHKLDAVPVVDGDHRVLGVVATSDLLLHITRHARLAPRGHRLSASAEARTKRDAMSASLLMTSPAITIGTGATIETAAELIAQHRVRMLPVIDADQRLLGVVTRNDLVTIFLRDDAEIAADITTRVLRPTGIDAGSTLQMDVVNGVVVLAGRAPDALTADRLAKECGLIIGVVAVRDHIERPLPTS